MNEVTVKTLTEGDALHGCIWVSVACVKPHAVVITLPACLTLSDPSLLVASCAALVTTGTEDPYYQSAGAAGNRLNYAALTAFHVIWSLLTRVCGLAACTSAVFYSILFKSSQLLSPKLVKGFEKLSDDDQVDWHTR